MKPRAAVFRHSVAVAVSIAFAAFSLMAAFAVPAALAHGEHGEAMPVSGGMSLFSFDGFQVELLGSPRPLRVGAGNKIVAKVLRDGSLVPVRDGKVYIGVLPARLANRSGTPGKVSNTDPGRAAISLSPAPETVWAGNYTLSVSFHEKGAHLVRVAITELEGKRFDRPAVFDFYVNVDPAAGFTSGFLLIALAASLIVFAGIYWAIVRSRPRTEVGGAFNLLDISWLRRAVIWKGFQSSLQIPMLVLIAAIAFLGFFDVQDGARNLATKLTWILWWPGIIFTFILVGRLWCVMCPFGAINEWASNMSKPARLFPKSLRSLWLATFLFLLLTWADEQVGVIRSPRLTAWLIVTFALAAFLTGIFFQRRSFCRYLCPITGLLGLYSMVSPVEVRARERSQCRKNCHQDCYRGNEQGYGCPMFEFPMTVERNTFCNLCFECVRRCPTGNLTLRFRAFGKDLWTTSKRSFDECYLAVVMVGVTTIVTAQMLTGWAGVVSALARMMPVPVRTLMKPVTYLNLTESVAFFAGSLVLFPVLVWAAAWAAKRFSSNNETSVKTIFMHFAYTFLPVGLAMHLAHNVSHLITEGPGVIPAFERMLSRYTPLGVGEPNWQPLPLLSADVIYWLQVLLILSGLIFSLIVADRLSAQAFKEKAGRAIASLALLALFFTLVNLYLLNQPMGARHGM